MLIIDTHAFTYIPVQHWCETHNDAKNVNPLCYNGYARQKERESPTKELETGKCTQSPHKLRIIKSRDYYPHNPDDTLKDVHLRAHGTATTPALPTAVFHCHRKGTSSHCKNPQIPPSIHLHIMLYIRVKFPAYVQLRTWCQVWNHTNVN